MLSKNTIAKSMRRRYNVVRAKQNSWRKDCMVSLLAIAVPAFVGSVVGTIGTAFLWGVLHSRSHREISNPEQLVAAAMEAIAFVPSEDEEKPCSELKQSARDYLRRQWNAGVMARGDVYRAIEESIHMAAE